MNIKAFICLLVMIGFFNFVSSRATIKISSTQNSRSTSTAGDQTKTEEASNEQTLSQIVPTGQDYQNSNSTQTPDSGSGDDSDIDQNLRGSIQLGVHN